MNDPINTVKSDIASTGTSNPADQPSGFSLATQTALVIAGMIGSGIYTTTGFALADLKSSQAVLIAWAIAGLIAVCGAISYGQLAKRVLDSGGEYLYLTQFIHPAAGFLAGWVSVLQGFTGAAALAAITFESYVLPESAAGGFPKGMIAASLIVVLTICHAIGVRTGRFSQNTVVVLKLLVLLIFLSWAFLLWPDWFINRDTNGDAVAAMNEALSESPDVPSVSASFQWFPFATSIMWISFSFTGFNSSIYVARESRSGVAGVRRSMVLGTAIVTVIYLVLNVVYLFAADPSAIAGQLEVAAVCVENFGSPSMSVLLRIAICLGLASSVSSMLMMGPRVYRRMAQDGVFPRILASSGPHFRTAVIAQGVAILIVVFLSDFKTLLSYLSMTLSLCSAGTIATLLFCRRDTKGQAFAKLSPGALLAAWIYFMASIAIACLACYGDPRQGIGTIVTVVSGLIIFYALEVLKAVSAAANGQSLDGDE